MLKIHPSQAKMTTSWWGRGREKKWEKHREGDMKKGERRKEREERQRRGVETRSHGYVGDL